MKQEAALFEFLEALRFDDLPDRIILAAEGAILDHLASALHGIDLPWTRSILKVALSEDHSNSDEGSARIYGSSMPVSARTAALVNGTASHGFELDDCYYPGQIHPGSVCCAAGIASALQHDTDGTLLLASIVAGYELLGRVGIAAGVLNNERGFHSAAMHGPLGSAATTSKILDPSGAHLRDSVGIAVSFGSGIKAFQNGNGMVKRIHCGWASQSGIYAATLANSGFEGPIDALTGKFGYVSVMTLGGEPQYSALSQGLGSEFVIDNTYVKAFSSCGCTHGAMFAAEELNQRPEIDFGEVQEIVVGVCDRILSQNSLPDPQDVMAAQYSVEYGVALALLGKARDPRSFSAAGSGSDREERFLISKMRIETDSEAESAYPKMYEGRVTVKLKDGSETSTYGRADASISGGLDVAESKFRTIAAGVPGLRPENCEQIIAAVRGLSDGGSVWDCLRPLEGLTDIGKEHS